MDEKHTMKRCLLGGLVLIVLAGLYWFCRDRLDVLRENRTKVGLRELKGALLLWEVKHGRFPGTRFSNVQATIDPREFRVVSSREIYDILEGKDAWGTPLHYEVTSVPQSATVKITTATIRSFGRNRIDDDGRGDDIEVRAVAAQER